ncbi:MAG: carbohydrate ABC transporter permease [Saccharofermentanales bacterium]
MEPISDAVSRKLRHMISQKNIIGILYRIVRAVIVFGICFMIIYPFLMKFIVAFMAEIDLYDPTVRYLPRNFSTENISAVLSKLKWQESLPLTMFLSLAVSALSVISCTLAAYGFARFRFPGSGILFGLVIFTLIVPPQTVGLSIFIRFKDFDFFGIINAVTGKSSNLLNTIWPFLIMSGTAVGFRNGLYIYLLRQYFKGVPKAFEEAAAIDGSGPFRTFAQIILPGAVPIMITVAMFAFAWQWTDSFFTNLLASQTNLMAAVLPAITAYMDPIRSSMMRNTASFLIVIPIIILYLLLQRFLVEGIERSGVVG